MTLVPITCPHCGKEAQKRLGHVNRAKKIGAPTYCSKLCSGLARKIERTDEEKKAIKAAYDVQYRRRDYVKVKKQAYFKRTYDPQKQAAINKARMPKHVEYCRRPQYKAYKKQYDEQHRAKKDFGEFWESALLVKQIEKQYDDKEVRQSNQLHNKSQKRKRQWQRRNNKVTENSLPKI